MWISVIIISVVGTFFHFFYEMSGHNKYVALFAAVNESTWEHIKIALTPTLLWGLYDGFVYGLNPNYFIAKTLSLLVIILVIPIIFYSYTHFTKKALLPIDIIIFYIAIVLGQLTFYFVVSLDRFPFLYNYLGVVGLFIIFGCYMILTLQPLQHFIFKDPISNKYGKEGHTELEHNHK